MSTANAEVRDALANYRIALDAGRNPRMIPPPTEVTIVRPKLTFATGFGLWLGNLLVSVMNAWLIMLVLPAIHPSLATISFLQVFLAYVVIRALTSDTNFLQWTKP